MRIVSVSEFIAYFDGIRSRTRRVADVIPADALEFHPQPHIFSPGDLIRHIAGTERYMFIENVLGRPSSYPGHGRELADGLDATLAYMDRLHAESIALLGTMADADLDTRCTTVGGAQMAAWKWLRAMVEHEVHHRGQLYGLLGLLGVATPPLYGLTEPEVRARSAARDER